MLGSFGVFLTNLCPVEPARVGVERLEGEEGRRAAGAHHQPIVPLLNAPTTSTRRRIAARPRHLGPCRCSCRGCP
jgi:hypothetical protein